MIRVIITGCRRWQALHVAETTCRRLQARYGSGLIIVHGACPTGVDAAFEDVCRRFGITQERFPADWSKGKRAGPERNRAMILAGADFAIAVHRNLGRSRGTRGTVELAMGSAIPVYLIDSNDCRPVRVLGFSGFEVRVASPAKATAG